MSDKSALRRTLLSVRSAIDASARQRMDSSICNAVLAWWSTHPVPELGVYWPIRGEPDLRFAYAELAARGARLSLPVVIGKHAPLKFSAWTPDDALAQDELGLPIPAVLRWVLPAALLIPCVGFNACRMRLGYGGGFYDQTLAGETRPLAIGIAYACGLTVFEADPHDVPLDRVITELG